MNEELGNLLIRLLFVDQQFAANAKRAQGSFQQTGLGFQATATAIGNVVADGFRQAVAAISDFVRSSAEIGAGFQRQVAVVGAIAQATSTELTALEGRARELGASTEFTATEAAQGLQALAQAGASVSESIRISGDALDFAIAQNTGLQGATEQVVSTLRQFQLQATESGRVTDVLTAATQSSLLNFQDLTEGLRFAGPAAGSFGISLEETVAGLAAFRDLGLEGSIAGTALRQALVRATDASDKQVRTLASVGLTLDDINPKTRGFAGLINAVAESTAETADIIQLFGDRAGPVVASAVDQVRAGVLDLDARTAQLGDSAGRTADTVSRVEDNVVGATRKMSSAFQDVQIAIFTGLQDPLQSALEAAAPFLNQISERVGAVSERIRSSLTGAVNNLNDALGRNGPEAADALVAGLVLLVDAFSAVVNVTSEVLDAFGLLSRVIKGLGLEGLVDDLVVVTGAAAALATGVGGLSLALGGATGATAGLATVVAALGGPLGATVAAVAALTFGWIQYRVAVAEAEEATRSIEEALGEVADRQTAVVSDLTGDQLVGDLRDASVAFAEGQREAARNGEQLNDVLRQEADTLAALKDLTDEEIDLKIASGELVVVGDQLRTVQGVVEDLDETGFEAIEDSARRFRLEAAAIERNLVEVRDRLAEAQEDAETFGERFAVFDFGTEAGAVRFIEEQEKRLEGLREAEENLIRQREQAAADLLEREGKAEEDRTRKAKQEADKRAATAKQEADERIREAKRAADTIAQILEQAEDVEAGLFLTDADQLQRELDQQENLVLDALEAFLANFAGSEEERRQVVAQSEQAIFLLRSNAFEQLRLLEEEALAQAVERAARRAQVVADATARELSQVEQIRADSAAAQRALEEALAEELAELARATEAQLAGVQAADERVRIIEEGTARELETERAAAEQRARVIEVAEARIQLALARTPAEILRARDALRELQTGAEEAGFAVEDVAAFLDDLGQQGPPLATAFDTATRSIQTDLVQRLGPETFEQISTAVRGLGEAISFLTGGATLGIQTLQQLVSEAQAAQQAAEDAVMAAQEALADTQAQEEEQAAEDLRAAEEAAREAQRALNEATREGDRAAIEQAELALRQAEQGVMAAGEALQAARAGTSEAITEAANELSNAQEELRRVGQEAGADVANAWVDGTLDFVQTLTTSLDDIIVTLISRVDEIVVALVEGLLGPDGIVGNLDKIVIALIELIVIEIPKAGFALSKAFFLDFPKSLRQAFVSAVKSFFTEFIPNLVQAGIDFANQVVDILTLGLSKLIRELRDPETSAGGEDQGLITGGGFLDDLERVITAPFRAIGNLFGGGASAPHGVPYVARTTQTLVHEGERILSAAENRPLLAAPGALERAVPPVGADAPLGGGFPARIEIVNQIGDRTLDRTLVEADQRGGLGASNQRSRQKTDTRVGFVRPSQRTK